MLHHYRAMVDDPLRLGAFERAIRAAVRPGDVVVDAGSGLGTFAVFACRAGAERVYAVEAGPILEVAREVVRANGCADRVRFLSGSSLQLDVPERAQVVVFEDYQTTLLSPVSLRVVRDLCARWLAPGGVLLPGRARQWVAPVEDAEAHHQLGRFGFTGERILGVDLTPTRKRAFSSPLGRQLGRAALLAAPSLARDLDLQCADEVQFAVRATVPAERSGAIHGLLTWFELELPPAWLGTGPDSPASPWQQTLFAFDPPLLAEAGAPIEIALEASPFGETMVWRWSASTGGQRREANSLEGMPMSSAALQLSRPDHVPKARTELQIDRAILDAVDEQRTLAQIADGVVARFPARFPTVADAQRHIAELLSRY